MKSRLFKPLPNANVYLCIISLISDAYLVACGCVLAYHRLFGIDIDNKKFKNDMFFLCALYLYESIVVFATNTTTLFRWNKFDFIVHHLPFVIVGGSTLLLDSILAVQTYSYTYNVGFLVAFNELAQTLCTLGVFKKRPQVNLYYTVIIVTFLAIAEFIESLNFLMYGSNGSWALYVHAISSVTYVPYYHIVEVVLRTARKIMRQRQRKQPVLPNPK